MKNDSTTLITGYLQGSLSQEETALFYDWVNKNASNKKRFFELKAMYDAGISLGKPMDMTSSWQRLLAKKRRTHPYRPNRWLQISTYAAVALLAVAISSAFFLFFHEKETGLYTQYIGGDGLEADVVVLPDGTRVSLGSKTTFHYEQEFGQLNRTVYLQGEAYFEVAKQKGTPFIVKTQEQKIEVLGTKFNVMAYPTDSLEITTLLEGTVRLTAQNQSEQIVMHPDQQLTYNRNTKKNTSQEVDAQQFISWTSGYYFFSEQSLKAILDRLSHVYGVKFTILSEELYKRTFTGTFYRGQSIKEIMEIINLSIPVKYKIDDRHITISEK